MSDPSLPLVDYEQKDLTELADILNKMEEGPNILTRAEFKPFEFLYQNHPAPKNEEEKAARDRKVDALTKAFVRIIDMYRPIHIVVSKTDSTVVLRLPQLFVPIKSMAPTDHNAQLVLANHQAQKLMYPSIKSKAQNRMTAAFRKQQADLDQISAIRTARAESRALVEEFQVRKGNTPAEVAKPSAGPASPTIDSVLSRAEVEDL